MPFANLYWLSCSRGNRCQFRPHYSRAGLCERAQALGKGRLGGNFFSTCAVRSRRTRQLSKHLYLLGEIAFGAVPRTGDGEKYLKILLTRLRLAVAFSPEIMVQ